MSSSNFSDKLISQVNLITLAGHKNHGMENFDLVHEIKLDDMNIPQCIASEHDFADTSQQSTLFWLKAHSFIAYLSSIVTNSWNPRDKKTLQQHLREQTKQWKSHSINTFFEPRRAKWNAWLCWRLSSYQKFMREINMPDEDRAFKDHYYGGFWDIRSGKLLREDEGLHNMASADLGGMRLTVRGVLCFCRLVLAKIVNLFLWIANWYKSPEERMLQRYCDEHANETMESVSQTMRVEPVRFGESPNCYVHDDGNMLRLSLPVFLFSEANGQCNRAVIGRYVQVIVDPKYWDDSSYETQPPVHVVLVSSDKALNACALKKCSEKNPEAVFLLPEGSAHQLKARIFWSERCAEFNQEEEVVYRFQNVAGDPFSRAYLKFKKISREGRASVIVMRVKENREAENGEIFLFSQDSNVQAVLNDVVVAEEKALPISYILLNAENDLLSLDHSLHQEWQQCYPNLRVCYRKRGEDVTAPGEAQHAVDGEGHVIKLRPGEREILRKSPYVLHSPAARTHGNYDETDGDLQSAAALYFSAPSSLDCFSNCDVGLSSSALYCDVVDSDSALYCDVVDSEPDDICGENVNFLPCTGPNKEVNRISLIKAVIEHCQQLRQCVFAERRLEWISGKLIILSLFVDRISPYFFAGGMPFGSLIGAQICVMFLQDSQKSMMEWFHSGSDVEEELSRCDNNAITDSSKRTDDWRIVVGNYCSRAALAAFISIDAACFALLRRGLSSITLGWNLASFMHIVHVYEEVDALSSRLSCVTSFDEEALMNIKRKAIFLRQTMPLKGIDFFSSMFFFMLCSGWFDMSFIVVIMTTIFAVSEHYLFRHICRKLDDCFTM